MANEAGCEFLLTEVGAGNVFADLALETEDAEKRDRNRSNALKAYTATLQFMDRVVFNQAEQSRFFRDLDLLKNKLSQLGIPYLKTVDYQSNGFAGRFGRRLV